MKNKKLLRALIICLVIILCPLLIYGIICASSYLSGFFQISKNIEYQNNRLEYLQNEYYTDSYEPCDEQKFADFDLEKALNEGVKINEIAIIGTHNSYQPLPTPQRRLHQKILNILYDGKKGTKYKFEMDPFTEQLEYGIRNLEIDVETVDKDGEVSFIVTHEPIKDNTSTAYDFAKGLEEIALWSDHNPDHLPVYLLIEPKGEVPSINNMKNFSLDYAKALDAIIREVLGDRLLTPEQMLGDYGSFEEMRTADSWPTLKEGLGKIIVLLHPCDVTSEYIDIDTSIGSQAMFPMLRFDDIDKPYASFILDNEPAEAVENNKKTVDEKNLMVRTRADSYPNFSDERYTFTDRCGSHIITTDYPPRSVRTEDHIYDFNGYTIKLLK